MLYCPRPSGDILIQRRALCLPCGEARKLMLLTYLFMWGPFLLFYLAFAVPCLLALRTRALDEASTALWALVIVSAPVMGPLAFVLLRPGARH